jgi:hypothetical protein
VQVTEAIPAILDGHAFTGNNMPRVGSHGQLIPGNFDLQITPIKRLHFTFEAKHRLLEVDVDVVVEGVTYAAELMVLALAELEDHIAGLVRVQVSLSFSEVHDLLTMLHARLYIEVNLVVV